MGFLLSFYGLPCDQGLKSLINWYSELFNTLFSVFRGKRHGLNGYKSLEYDSGSSTIR